MADWPDIPNASVLPFRHIKRQIKAGFQSGYVHSHAAETRSRKRWPLSWKVLKAADLSTLITFFDNNLGGTFNWTNPADSVTYVVRFSEGVINFTYGGDDPTYGVYYVDVSLGLEEN